MDLIPHSRPRFPGSMQAAVTALLQSGRVVAGREVALLERTLCAQVGRGSAVAVDSGTSALMLALRLLGRDRDAATMRVGIPAFACASLLVAVRSAGMVPCTLDCDPETLGLTAEATEQPLDAVVVVHPFGMVEPLVAADWHCPIIEDIAQSAGGAWRDRPLGSWGEIAIASFHATKPWGGAYGGALLLDDDAHAVALRRMIDPDGEIVADGYVGHHQLSDLHALLARMRIAQSNDLMARRAERQAELAGWLRQAGAAVCAGVAGNHFRLLARVEGLSSQTLVQRFRDYGVAAARPIKQPLSRLTGAHCPGAEAAFAQWVSLPLLADCSEGERERLRAAIARVVAG